MGEFRRCDCWGLKGPFSVWIGMSLCEDGEHFYNLAVFFHIMRGCLLLQYVSLLFLAAMQTKLFAFALNDLLVIKHKSVVAAVKMSPRFFGFFHANQSATV